MHNDVKYFYLNSLGSLTGEVIGNGLEVLHFLKHSNNFEIVTYHCFKQCLFSEFE